jgi:hypothetical protein
MKKVQFILTVISSTGQMQPRHLVVVPVNLEIKRKEEDQST